MRKLTFVIGIMGKGGAERVIANLANNFIQDNWEIDIITIYGNRQDYELNRKIQVHPIICKSSFRAFRPLERFKELRKKIREIQPDLVISFLADVNIHVIISLLGVKQKLIVSERNDPQRNPEEPWIRKIRDFLYKNVDGIVFQTPDAKKYFSKINDKKVKTIIIPNPIKENLPYYNKTTSSKKFITACRLDKQKNLPLMIDAIGKLIHEGYECELDIYGEGGLKTELESYINHNGLTEFVHLKEFTNKIHEKMQNAAGFVIS
ncbi:TPA: glycosyltransferase, partial [Enterococcus faecium]